MILLLNTFITEKRQNHLNRYSRFDIFKYTLYSYRNIPFTHIYLFIKLDNEYIHKENELSTYIYSIFTTENIHIHIIYDRYDQQIQWLPIFNKLIQTHDINEAVLLLNNDDNISVISYQIYHKMRHIYKLAG